MTTYVGAIDQGTTSTRFMVFDHGGNEIARHQLEHEQIMPRPGWVEHSPFEIWERTSSVLKTTLARAGMQGSDLAALGITNQRETTVVWNRRTGRPCYNAIVWQDTRTDSIAKALDGDGRGDIIRRKTGLPPATYFSGGKIQWILENVDGVREAAEAGDAIFGNTDSWLLWNLTGGTRGGVHVTDVTNASRTMLMNLETLEWDDELLEMFDIPRQMLPEIRPSSDPGLYGRTLEDGPLGAAVPLSASLGDQQAAMVGQVCLAPGEAKNTYGTGNFLLLNTGRELVRSENGLLTTICYQFGDEAPVYALEGSIAVTGSAVQWLRDQLGIISGASQSEALAREVPDNGGVYFVPGLLGALRAVLALRRPRRDRRPVPLQHQRPRRAGDAGVDLLPEPRRGRRDGEGLRGPPRGAQGRRRRDRQRPVHADPGRRARGAGQPAGRRRDDRAGSRVRRGPGRRVLEGPRGAAPELERGQALGALLVAGAARRGVRRLAEGRDQDLRLGGRHVSMHPASATPLDPASRARRAARDGARAARRAGHRRRGGRRGRGAGRRDPGPAGRAGRGPRLRLGHLEPLQQADPRRACATSSSSNFGLVREALRERSLILNRLCPHLARPVPFLYPLQHRFWERLYVGSGVLLYDTMGGRHGVPTHRHLTKRQALREFPSLRRDALVGAIKYYDGQVDDARHTMMVARTAAEYGALCATSARVHGFLREGDRVSGARVRDLETGEELEVRARQTINAAGRVDRRDPGHGRRPRPDRRAGVQGRAPRGPPGPDPRTGRASSAGPRRACCSSSRGAELADRDDRHRLGARPRAPGGQPVGRRLPARARPTGCCARR